MSTVVAVLTAFTEPVVAASSLLLWLPAAVLATAAQVDRPTGPAPRANRHAARSALVLVRLGLGLGLLQLAAGTAALAGWVPAPVHVAAWPALVAAVTGALLAAGGAVAPLRRLRAGRPVTDPAQLRRLHAAVRSAVVAGALATLAVVLGSGLQPTEGEPGLYVAPTAVVAAAVLAVHSALSSAVLVR